MSFYAPVLKTPGAFVLNIRVGYEIYVVACTPKLHKADISSTLVGQIMGKT